MEIKLNGEQCKEMKIALCIDDKIRLCLKISVDSFEYIEAVDDPKPKQAEAIDMEEKKPSKGILQLRAEKLMRRRPETPLTENERRAFKKSRAAIEATTEDQWLALERYYAAPQAETFSRKDLSTLVNNWNGEIDRALAWNGNRVATAPRRVKTAEDFDQ